MRRLSIKPSICSFHVDLFCKVRHGSVLKCVPQVQHAFKAKTWRFNGFSLQAKQRTFSQSSSFVSPEPENVMMQFGSKGSCTFLDNALAFLFSNKV